MRHWNEAFHQQLRETNFPGQIDIFQEMEMTPPFRPNCLCKQCGKPWTGEDANSTPARAKERGVWYVSHKIVRCPDCHRGKTK